MHIVAEKCGPLILIALTAWLILFSTITRAEAISEHNAEYTAVDAARSAMMIETNCTQTKTVLRNAEKYKAEKESGKYFVTRGRLEITCIQYAVNKPIYLITWNVPTHREDGSEILPAQIAGYQMLRDGQIIDISPCCEFMTDNLDGLFIRTVDVSGLVSKSVEVK